MTVGQRLKETRTLSGLSTKEVDKLAGISPGHTWTLEKAETASAEAKTLNAVCVVLGLSLDYLVRGEGEPPTKEQIDAAVATARVELEARQAGALAAGTHGAGQ